MILKRRAEILEYTFNYKDPGKKNWEKTELIYKNFKILPNRPGGIQIRESQTTKNYSKFLTILKLTLLTMVKNILKLRKPYMKLEVEMSWM